jgi:aspartate racemase
MDFTDDKVIGIVGGMGPQAGADLLNHIFRLTKATKDQHHRSVILMSFPRHIADRTEFMEGKVKSNPAFTIARIISKLESAGAAVAGIACNSSHIPEIYNVITGELDRLHSRIKLLHMPFETCSHIRKQHPHIHRVGVMSTNGTYKSGIYKDILQRLGMEAVVPEFEFQDEVIHKMIYHPRYGIKSRTEGVTKEVNMLLEKALLFFKEAQVGAIILGCTELSLVLGKRQAKGMLIVNSNEVMAEALLRETEHSSDMAISGRGEKLIDNVS